MDLKLALVGAVPVDYRVWVVVNNHTLSIYMDGQDFNTIYRTYNLPALSPTPDPKEPKCILLREAARNDTLCVVDQNVRKSVAETRDTYLAQLLEFKNDCH